MFDSPNNAIDPVQDDEYAGALRREAAAVRALRRYVRRHNWQALVLAIFSLVAAVLLWGGAYLLLYWLCLIVVTIKRSYNVETLSEINDPHIIAWFPWAFLAGALLLLLASRGISKFCVGRLRDARQYLLLVIAEVLVAIPNATFSIWGNLAALVRLRQEEAVRAWHLLECMHQAGDRLSASGLRMIIEDERQLEHVVFVLQIVGLVELREKREGWFLCLQDRDAFARLSQGEATA